MNTERCEGIAVLNIFIKRKFIFVHYLGLFYKKGLLRVEQYIITVQNWTYFIASSISIHIPIKG